MTLEELKKNMGWRDKDEILAGYHHRLQEIERLEAKIKALEQRERALEAAIQEISWREAPTPNKP